MKLILTALLFLAGAVGLGMLAIEDPGYVVLHRAPYEVRMPLPMLILLLVLAFMLLYLLVNFIVSLFRAKKNYRQWRQRANEKSAGKHALLGFAGLVEGDWHKAEAALLKKIDYNHAALMNYLGAAYAAHQQGHYDRRDQYLDEAQAMYPKQRLAVSLTRARMLYQVGDFAAARKCLEDQRSVNPKSAPLLRLLAEVYRNLEDWDALVTLTPALKRLRAYPEQEQGERETQAYTGLIASAAMFQGEWEKKWAALPATVRKNTATVAAYSARLIQEGEHKEAEKVLRRALNQQYRPDLIRIYGQVCSPFLAYQIQLAESFIKKHGDDPELKLALARLYRLDGQNARARELFTEVLEVAPSLEAVTDFAALCEQTGDSDYALMLYRKSLQLAQPATTPSTPAREGELVVLNPPFATTPKSVAAR